jgi:hypothetical protein
MKGGILKLGANLRREHRLKDIANGTAAGAYRAPKSPIV